LSYQKKEMGQFSTKRGQQRRKTKPEKSTDVRKEELPANTAKNRLAEGNI